MAPRVIKFHEKTTGDRIRKIKTCLFQPTQGIQQVQTLLIVSYSNMT